MKTNKDPNGLITQESNMVAPQELFDDASWTIVESKKTRKKNKKERLQHLAQFLLFLKSKEGQWPCHKNQLPQSTSTLKLT